MTIDANDPKLTAYALGELDDAERTEVEAQLEHSPELQRAVDEIRETAGVLTTQFQAEPCPALSDDQRRAIDTAAAKANGAATIPHRRRITWRSLRIPASLAASVLILVGAWSVFMPQLMKSGINARDRLQLSQSGLEAGADDSSLLRSAVDAAKPMRASVKDKKETGVGGGPPRRGGELGGQTTVVKDSVSRSLMVSPADATRVFAKNPNGTGSVSETGGPTVRNSLLDVEGGGGGGGAGSRGVFGGGSGGTDARGVPRGQYAALSTQYVSTRAALRRARGGGGGARPVLGGRLPGARYDRYSLSVAQALKAPVSASGNLNLEWRPLGELDERWPPDGQFNTEAYDQIVENPFLLVTQQPLSTFSIDVDTASYANVRRFLTQGSLPPPGAVRIEEMINYFDYDYPPPVGDDPFSVSVEIAECPWEPDHRLARIGLKGYEIVEEERAPANLVFLIDVSGSMNSPDKLPLLKQSLRLLVSELSPDDTVAMVVYAGASGLVLPSNSCESNEGILAALDNLQAGGSTNGGAGIQLAYDTAVANFIEGGINRVILATDGDFNVGVTDRGSLIQLIEEKAKSGVFLSVLGFGTGNLKDSTMEKLADKGNGNYAYIDKLSEGRKVLVEQMGGTLVTIAKDVKIQIEFNPTAVAAYRLIGYENRLLAAQDFNDDTKDAGEIGAGHTVTALYEIVPAGDPVDLPAVDPLKYQTVSEPTDVSESGELMTVKLRYKQPDGDTSKLLEVPVTDAGGLLADASDDFAFQAAVASFGMLLRGSKHVDQLTYGAVLELAGTATGEDPHGYREEFLGLVNRAIELK